jgi:hypothetical protein
LAKPIIREQILQVESAIQNYPKYEKILGLHKRILNILLPLDESQKRGAKIALSNETLDNFLEKTISSRKPMSSFFNESDFDSILLSDVAKNIVKLLIDANADGDEMRRFSCSMENGDVVAREAIGSILREDSKWFKNQSEKYGVDSALLLLIFDSPLRPFFEQIARHLEEMIKETWLEPYCPVCGRQSNVARKRNLNRYMICSYCGLEYLVDMFKCINCWNIDPTSMGFIKINGQKDYELNYCEACNHYIKILDEDTATRKIPRGLEEILTRELDNFAKDSDLHLKRT